MHKSISDYLEKVNSGKLVKPKRCQACGLGHVLKWHGKYYRSLITLTHQYLIPIKRLYCSFCHHTFALLPFFVEKFHRYAKETIRFVLQKLKSLSYEAVANLFMEHGQHDVASRLFMWRHPKILKLFIQPEPTRKIGGKETHNITSMRQAK